MHRWYIKYWRSSVDNELYFAEKFTRRQARQDLILIANHKDWYFYVRGNKIDVKRWQVARGEKDLCLRRKWSRDKTRKFLKDLENMQQIIQQKNRLCSIYTIVNYDKYQTTDDTTEQTTEKHQNRQQKNINKNDKNDKEWKEDIETPPKPKKKFVPPTIEQVVSYFRENGYVAVAGEKAWKYYNSAGWVDSKWNQVKNRKQKMLGVRFKEENKDKTKSRGLTEAQRQERLDALSN